MIAPRDLDRTESTVDEERLFGIRDIVTSWYYGTVSAADALRDIRRVATEDITAMPAREGGEG